MNNEFVFLRHAETERDSSVNAIHWKLTEEGANHAKKISNDDVFLNVDIIFSSEEDKAYSTALPIAEKNALSVIKDKAFNELRRGDKFLSNEDFDRLKREKLTDLDCAFDGGETGREALTRFKEAISMIDKENSGKKIVIVSHGTILSLYFFELMNYSGDIFSRWKKMEFCAWGIVIGGRIVKDIVNS